MGGGSNNLFERFVAVGDSLSQGTWNVGTAADSQPWGLPAILARQAGARLRLPLLAAPGDPPQIWPASRLVSKGLNRDGWGARLSPEGEIDNYAVPGARVADLVALTPAGLATADRPWPLKSLLRRILNPLARPEWEHASQLDRAVAADPTLVHLLVGANDLLECFFNPEYTVTPPAQFERSWRRLLGRLLHETAAEVVVVLVPALAVAPSVQVHRRRRRLMRCCWRTIDAYNRIIREAAAGRERVLVVDLNEGLLEAAANGIDVRGWNLPFKVRDDRLTLAPPVGVPGRLWGGGLLSYDGLHPTRTGYAMLANGVIEAVNDRYGLQVPLCDLPAIAAEDPLLTAPNLYLWPASAATQRLTFDAAAAKLARADWPWVSGV